MNCIDQMLQNCNRKKRISCRSRYLPRKRSWGGCNSSLHHAAVGQDLRDVLYESDLGRAFGSRGIAAQEAGAERERESGASPANQAGDRWGDGRGVVAGRKLGQRRRIRGFGGFPIIAEDVSAGGAKAAGELGEGGGEASPAASHAEKREGGSKRSGN